VRLDDLFDPGQGKQREQLQEAAEVGVLPLLQKKKKKTKKRRAGLMRSGQGRRP
jgi:hypothetical protein